MKALISPTQDNLVVQVEENNNIFDVALPLYWIDCPNDIKAGYAYYQNDQFIIIPEPPPPNPPLPGN
jgi:hypothetical protein